MTAQRTSNASNLRELRLEIRYWNYIKDVKRRATKSRPKAVGSGILSRFLNFDKCRSEVAGDVISGVAVESVGMDVRVTFGESVLNSGQIILFTLWPAEPVLRINFVRI